MQITITGPRGGGATNMAVAIAAFLQQKHGAIIEFRTETKRNNMRLEGMLRATVFGGENVEIREGTNVVIVEGFEREDERSVTQ